MEKDERYALAGYMLNAFFMLADLFKIGKDLRSATQQDLNDPDNPMRMIMYALHTWKDEEVSNGISTNVRRGQGEKAVKCHPLGQLRFGWDIAGAYIDGHGKYHSGDHYEINQREAEAVRTMYRLRARGFAWTAIARTLNEKGYKNKYGRPITDVMVAGIVRNEAYKGVYAFGHVRVEGGLPRIVADAEWDAAIRNGSANARHADQRKSNGLPASRRGKHRIAAVCLAMDEIGTILGGSNENEKRA